MINVIAFIIFILCIIIIYIVLDWKDIYTKNALYLKELDDLGWRIDIELIDSQMDDPVVINTKINSIVIYNDHNPYVLNTQLNYLIKYISTNNKIPVTIHSEKLLNAYNEINECFFK